MKIAYVVCWSLTGRSGIERKIENQIFEWREQGHEVEVFAVSDTIPENLIDGWTVIRRRRPRNLLLRFFTNAKVYRSLGEKVRDFGPDVIYHRAAFFHPVLGQLLFEFPSVVEVNGIGSKEVGIGAKESFEKRLLVRYMEFTHSKLMNRVNGLVGVNSEIIKRESRFFEQKKRCLIPNSVVLKRENFKKCAPVQTQSRVPRIAFICGYTVYDIKPEEHYHGIDKVIELAKLTEGSLEFDFIGDTKMFSGQVPANVTLHGVLSAEQFEGILKSADVGLGSAAYHRKGVIENSALKICDYLSCGLPIIVPYTETAFVGKEQPVWLLPLPNNDSNLIEHRAEIIKFARLFQGQSLLLEDVSPFVGSATIERRRIEFLERIARS